MGRVSTTAGDLGALLRGTLGGVAGVSVTPIEEADRIFLLELFLVVRASPLRAAGLAEEELGRLVVLQYEAQQRGYAASFGEQGHRLIRLEGEPVGRAWLGSDGSTIRLIDVALLPAARGRGIGTTVLAAVLAQATALGLTVSLRVEQGNDGAIRLYERLGFLVVSSGAIDQEMEWAPPGNLPGHR